ncbi:MAG: MarR family transcriptional regulator [Desulfobacteraceae bacterium]|jgi:MarR family transcriptional regulator, organic hydroperoxide resistance regulator
MEAKPDTQKPTLGHLLANVSRLVGSRMRMKLEEIGLHHAQGMILFHLWREDGIPQNALAQCLHITPPTATNTLQRMERDGWIQRRRDSGDQRVVRVYLTEKAAALRKEAGESFRELDRELTAQLSAEERKILMASLSKVREYLLLAMQTPDRSGPGEAGKEHP